MAQVLRPSSTVTLDAGWAIVGAGTAHAALSDSSDASYCETGTEGDVMEVGLQAGGAPPVGGLHRLWARTRRFGASAAPVTIDFSVRSGGALAATRSHAQPSGVGFAWYSWDLTLAEAALIGNYADLRIRSVDTQTVGAVTHRIAEQYMELDDPDPGTPPANVIGERMAVQSGKRRPRVQAEGVAP